MAFLRKMVEKVTPPKVSLVLNLNKGTYFLGEKV